MDAQELHPLIPAAQELLHKQATTRRDFLRFATLLGLSFASAQLLAACSGQTATRLQAPMAAVRAPDTSNPPAMPSITRGGILTAATRIERVDHPARFSLVSQSHPWRHVFDYLTYTDPNGITHPYLLEKWAASDDLLTWTLKLKKGILFNNGKELTADDVLFSFGQWLDVDIGSPLLGTMSYLSIDGLEKVDPYAIRCNLSAPSIFLPEHLFHYAACVLPEEFEGDITHQPVGTGAFTMQEYLPGERCRLKARRDYWRMGADGQPLPYLDEIVMIQLGEDRTADIAALQAGQIDAIIEPGVSVWEAFKDDANFSVISIPTAAARVLRVRVDQEPWTNNLVRQALKHCHNRPKILEAALLNQGTLGNDTHVAPVQPEFMPVEPYPFDTVRAKALLKEAGYPNGLSVELTVASDWPKSMAYAQALKEDAAAGGFNIHLNPMPARQYWEGWTEFNMGITWWAHRPLAPMLLAQAYVRDAQGNPIPWNETRWLDDEFEDLLRQAEGQVHLTDRRHTIGRIEQIMKERGPVCVPFFMNVWKIHSKAVHGVDPSPEEYAIFHEAWKAA